MDIFKKVLFFALIVASVFVSPVIALFAGILFALLFEGVYKGKSSKISSILLKVAIVGLGFGMNLHKSLQSSADGIIFTIFSVILVMVAGFFLGKIIGLDKKLTHLISSGTAICGGSAIAAVAPVIRAKSEDISISLAVVFTLNGIAMFTFPYIGVLLGLDQSQFGMWAAIAIHDTSAVVGAAKQFGNEALEIATTIKLSRALWIIPLSLVSALMFRTNDGSKTKISIPWFIFLFILAMLFNTYVPIPQAVSSVVKTGSYALLQISLFVIGTTLSKNAILKAGVKPIILSVLLWILISVVSLLVILF